MKKCFFCDALDKIIENNYFYARSDDYPLTPGHTLIVPKNHIESFFDLTNLGIMAFYDLLRQTQEIIQMHHNPGGYNIGVNEGKVAGRTFNHLHVHLIPRYEGDTNSKSGIRMIIPEKADYKELIEKDPAKQKYL